MMISEIYTQISLTLHYFWGWQRYTDNKKVQNPNDYTFKIIKPGFSIGLILNLPPAPYIIVEGIDIPLLPPPPKNPK